ncbi:MAG: hypothetical protein ACUVUC_15025 [Thermoguttaceae bacterium]
MAEPTGDIERVVREVLAEMGLLPQAGRPPGPVPGAGAAPVPQRPPLVPGAQPADGQITLCGRTISLADLPGRLEGVRRVVVPTGAVVTPSVQDELKRRSISLVRADPLETPAGPVPVILVSVDSPLDPALLVKAIQSDGYPVESRHVECLIRATDELARDLAGGHSLGVLLTRHAAAAMCLANRLAGVRAVRASTPETVASEADAVGANLLVVDTSAVRFFPAKQMVARFLRGGLRECPRPFQQRLA